MANENDRFALRTDDHLGRGNIAFEGKRRILDDSDAVVVLQKAVNALPAGAVHETTVDENHGRAASVRGSSCLSHLSTFLPLSPAGCRLTPVWWTQAKLRTRVQCTILDECLCLGPVNSLPPFTEMPRRVILGNPHSPGPIESRPTG